VEAAGISTVLVSTGRDLTKLVHPPRSLFVNFPMGNPFGPPNKPDYQRDLLRTALQLATLGHTSGEITDVRDTWPSDFTDEVVSRLLTVD